MSSDAEMAERHRIPKWPMLCVIFLIDLIIFIIFWICGVPIIDDYIEQEFRNKNLSVSENMYE